jgi:hypothetical protein
MPSDLPPNDVTPYATSTTLLPDWVFANMAQSWDNFKFLLRIALPAKDRRRRKR